MLPRSARARRWNAMTRSITARDDPGSLKLRSKTLWCFVNPSGTMHTSRMPGRAYAQASVSSSTAPSFWSGTSTIWAWNSMPASSSRSSTSMPCCACLPIMRRRTSGSATCSDRRRGDMRCSTMRRSSSGFRLVNVTKVPARKLRRKSSSRKVSEERISSGSWRMKQNVQALRHCLTPSNTTPSNSKPQSSPSSRSSSTTPSSPSRST